MGTLLFI